MTTRPAAPEGPDTPAARTPDYGVLRWLVAATFVVILNETIMVNAIPRLTVELGVSERTGQWLTSAFLLTMAVVIPTTGWFLQRVTTRQAFGSAMAVFAAGTLLAAAAPVFEVLLAARIVQAVGTAVMVPLLMTTLLRIVAEGDRGRVMGNVTLAMSVAPALGPAVSGVILAVASWRWMFLLVLPVAVVLTLVGLRRLVDVGETRAGVLDWASVALSVLGFGPLVYGLSQLGGGTGPGWAPWLALGVGAAGVAGFVGRQLALQRGGVPLLDLRTLRHRPFRIGLALMALAFMAMLGSMVLLPFYLQDVRGLTELESGLLVMPGGLAMGLLGPHVGRVYDRLGGRPLIVPGAVGVAIALGLFTRVDATMPIWLLLPVHLLLMVSLAAVFTPVFTVSLGSLPPELYSHGSSTLGALQQVAASAGSALVIAVLAARTTGLLGDGTDAVDAQVGGMQWAFGVGAIIALGVLALALVMPGRPSHRGDGAVRVSGPDEDVEDIEDAEAPAVS